MPIGLGLGIDLNNIGSAFSPSKFAGLELWLDADLSPDVSSIATGDWKDLSGNNRDVSPSGSPTYEATGWGNGTAQIDFDGFDDYFSVSLGAGGFGDTGAGNGYTVFILANPDNASNATYEQLWHTPDIEGFWNNSSDSVALYIGALLSFTGYTQSASEQLLTFNFVDGRPDNNDAYLYVDQTQQTPVANVASTVSLDNTLNIGRHAISGRYFPGKIKAILIYSRAFELGGAEQTAVENYLMQRGGLL